MRMGLRKRRRNTIITSPQIYEDREIEIFVPRQARAHSLTRLLAYSQAQRAAPFARSTEHFQLWHYNLLPPSWQSSNARPPSARRRRGRREKRGRDYINLISSSLTMLANSAREKEKETRLLASIYKTRELASGIT